MADDDFERSAEIGDEERLIVDVDGFEGPLDLLLELARRQKVDLQKVSILALAEQYLAFVETARMVRLELAADYLVMAAWLAYLKSRLLLPRAKAEDEPEVGDLAAALAARLRRAPDDPPCGRGARKPPAHGAGHAAAWGARRHDRRWRTAGLDGDDVRSPRCLRPSTAETGEVADDAEASRRLVVRRSAEGPATAPRP